MPDFEFKHAPEAIHEDTPLFFRRDDPFLGFPIFGYAMRSTFAEDHPKEERAWLEQKRFLSYCYSVAEPDGEMSMSPALRVTPISKEAFLAAAARSWKDA